MLETQPRLISELYPVGEYARELALSKLDQQAKCCHYWLIDKPNGPVSRGVCKFCHEERLFSNAPIERSSRDMVARHDKARGEYLRIKQEERIVVSL